MRNLTISKTIPLLLFLSFFLCGCSIHGLTNSNVGSSSLEVGEKPKTIRDINTSNGDFSMPSIGESHLLVIPVMLTDFASNATEANRKNIEKAFSGSSDETSWESVASFYEKSSYGKFHLSVTVSNWFDCGYSSSEIASFTDKSSSLFDPTWRIAQESMEWYKSTYQTNGQELDADKDGLIDGLFLVYSAPNYKKKPSLNHDVYWAYTYSLYDSKERNIKSPTPYRYSWASYDFVYAGYGSSGVDAHTYIHEAGHLLGLGDYYVSKTDDSIKANYSPVGGVDMMDANIIDHNSFSKLALGWIEPTVCLSSGAFSLKPYESSGDCLLIPTDSGWNGTPFDEYMLLEFYTPDGLNEKDSLSAYPGNFHKVKGFSTKGIRIFHVDARMTAISISASAHYVNSVSQSSNISTFLAHNNSSAYNLLNPEYRLIQLMDKAGKRNFDMDNDRKSSNASVSSMAYADSSCLFTEGDSFSLLDYKDSFPNYRYHSKIEMNNHSTFSKKVTITSLDQENATISVS